MSPAQQLHREQTAAAEQAAKAEAALRQQREAAVVENEQRRRDLAALVQQPDFQRTMLGDTGFLGAAEAEALADLADNVQTPLNDPVKMAVHLDRWRTLKTMRAALAALPDEVQNTPVPAPATTV
ncbi:MAG: hypothetical protein R3F13_13280 [Prosthecobacter sp.]